MNQFTVSGWFKTSIDYEAKNSRKLIANKGGFGSESTGQNMNYGIWMMCGTGISCIAGDGNKIEAGYENKTAGDDVFIKSTNEYNNNKWQLATVTFDGTTLKLYINGTQVASSTVATNKRFPDNTGTQVFRVGANSQADDRWFTGNIDDVRVWGRALSAQEVQNMYTGSPPDGTRIYMNLNS